MEQVAKKETIVLDEYITIAYQRYEGFKESNTYDEEYKREILTSLNNYFKETPINESTITDIIKKLQASNPPAGSFVHWSNMSDLVDFASNNPAEVATLLKALYTDETASLTDRIDAIREAGKKHNGNIKLGAPLFGYLLAAWNLETYPLYKEDVFKAIKKVIGIDKKLGTVAENYAFYYEICLLTQDYLNQKGHALSMLDIQDFFYCITQYEELVVECAVEYLYFEAKKLAHYAENETEFLEVIKSFDPETLKKRRDFYRTADKINKIKYLLLDQFLTKGHVEIADLEKIKTEVKEEHDKNILHRWDNFSILFHIYYFTIKEQVNYQLGLIHQGIRNMEGFSELELVEDKAIFDFNGSRNLGGSRCWLAVYPKVKENHKQAAQLFFAIDEKGIEFGLYYGTEHPKDGERYIEKVSGPKDFRYELLRRKYSANYDLFVKENGLNSNGRDEPEDVLHQTLRTIFDTREQAAWAFDYANETLTKLGIQNPGDNRVAITYPTNRKIHIDFCNWLVLGFQRGKEDKLLVYAALIESEIQGKPYDIGLFTQKEEETQIALTGVPFEEFRNSKELQELFDRSLIIIKERFQGYAKSPYRKSNVLRLEEAVFDLQKRDQLFVEGIPSVPEGPDVEKEWVDIPTINFQQDLHVHGLHFEGKDLLLKQVKTALQNGKHIIFTGPPGTGKSKLAKEVCRSFGADFKMATATSEWSTYETIGGYRPNKDGTLSFRPGIFLDCFKDRERNNPTNKWLIIDEMNRADIDKAFGALFSALTGDEVALNFEAESGQALTLRPQGEEEKVIPNDSEYIIPKDWRLIGTINTMDKASLYEMSYAFMRRFAFIPVGVPKEIHKEQVESYLVKWQMDGYEHADTLAFIWQRMNQYRQIGPAIIEDIANYTNVEADFTSAIILYVLPQLEGLREEEIRGFIEQLGQVGEINTELLSQFAEDFFHLKG
ncbi:MAG: AAA family ATPase [Bacillus sp. (in: Bacteria)]|nr:AAA family ATPase [Bacillus sp. (in: firmicutes)]